MSGTTSSGAPGAVDVIGVDGFDGGDDMAPAEAPVDELERPLTEDEQVSGCNFFFFILNL